MFCLLCVFLWPFVFSLFQVRGCNLMERDLWSVLSASRFWSQQGRLFLHSYEQFPWILMGGACWQNNWVSCLETVYSIINYHIDRPFYISCNYTWHLVSRNIWEGVCWQLLGLAVGKLNNICFYLQYSF